MANIINDNKAWIDETWNKIDLKMKRSVPEMKGKIPYKTIDGKYDDMYANDPDWWTNGFWGGMMWILYKKTQNPIYRDAAIDCENLLDKAYNERYTRLHHDVGFMWDITSGVHYRLEDDAPSKKRALETANLLFSRFNIKGGFIRAWNSSDAAGWTIIDTMMNLPLLYRASQITGDMRYTNVAMAHADMVMNAHVRPDSSVAHIVSHDVETGEVIEFPEGQGYSPDSSWSRGQAWALYGFTLSYIFTKKQEYLDMAKRIAHYFIASVANDDYLPRCDFKSPDEPVIYDSTAGACAACGLIELANCVGEFEKNTYLAPAVKMLKAMDKKFCNWNTGEDSILQYGTHSYKNRLSERHIHIIYGDYFFVEAMYKLSNGDTLFW